MVRPFKNTIKKTNNLNGFYAKAFQSPQVILRALTLLPARFVMFTSSEKVLTLLLTRFVMFTASETCVPGHSYTLSSFVLSSAGAGRA